MGPSQGPQGARNNSNIDLKKKVEGFFKNLESSFYTGRQSKSNDQAFANFIKLRSFLTDARDKRPSGYMSQPRLRDAYLKYYLPQHLPEAFWLLDNLVQKNPAFLNVAQSWKNISDFGSGPGTASLSVIFWLYKNHITDFESWTLYDHSDAILKQGLGFLKNLKIASDEKIFKGVEMNLKADIRTQLRHRSVEKAADLHIFSHVLNEMGNGPRHRDQKFEIFEKFFDLCFEQNKTSTFIIIEPPLREPTMDLMGLRDRFAELDFVKIWAPCPHGRARCPMALAKAGWCYTQTPREFLKSTGLLEHDLRIGNFKREPIELLSFSYLVFTVDPSLGVGEKAESLMDESDVESIEDHEASISVEKVENSEGGHKLVQVSDSTRNPGIFCDGTKLKKRSIELDAPKSKFYRGAMS